MTHKKKLNKFVINQREVIPTEWSWSSDFIGQRKRKKAKPDFAFILFISLKFHKVNVPVNNILSSIYQSHQNDIFMIKI